MFSIISFLTGFSWQCAGHQQKGKDHPNSLLSLLQAIKYRVCFLLLFVWYPSIINKVPLVQDLSMPGYGDLRSDDTIVCNYVVALCHQGVCFFMIRGIES